ncbi:MAG: hypothetical protein H7Y88_06340 [Phycisphaerales bacterium]|nr:hypothetical protein [Phycisphaerales bacterium]
MNLKRAEVAHRRSASDASGLLRAATTAASPSAMARVRVRLNSGGVIASMAVSV